MIYKRLQNYRPFNLKHFDYETILLESRFLKKNKLGDSNKRLNPILCPKETEPNEKYPLVIVLAGFTGNGTKYFNERLHEDNFPQSIDAFFAKKAAPKAYYLFVDALSFWGGSQFIDSPHVGKYESYIVKELIPTVLEEFPVHQKKVCVFGGSSGGYGALHLASKYPEKFQYVAAIAPDSDFDLSLYPEILQAAPYIKKFGGISGVKKDILSGKFHRSRQSHLVLNVLGMAHCYSGSGAVKLPLNEKTGDLNKVLWKAWKKHDPVEFLRSRCSKVKKIKKVFLTVGEYDQFNLQYGTRKIKNILKQQKVNLTYIEFPGTHFDISDKRKDALEWLLKVWK